VLANPLDREARTRLADLRQRQQAVRHSAWSALARGLEARTEGKASQARKSWEQVQGSPFVVRFARDLLGAPVEQVLEGRVRTSTCTKCGGTHLADCGRCQGAGVRMCSRCRGDGRIRGRFGEGEEGVCPDCHGTGATTCDRCQGYGVEECTRCAEVAADNQASGEVVRLVPGALERLLGYARYFERGGIDLYTSEARRGAPRLPAGGDGDGAADSVPRPAPRAAD
jgi:hypothetical protein